jgi:hypothetical protein
MRLDDATDWPTIIHDPVWSTTEVEGDVAPSCSARTMGQRNSYSIAQAALGRVPDAARARRSAHADYLQGVVCW